MFKPEYNAHVVIVDYPVMGGDRTKTYAFCHDDGTFFSLDGFDPLPGDVEIIGHTDTVAAYNLENGIVTQCETFILQENIVSDDDDEWMVV